MKRFHSFTFWISQNVGSENASFPLGIKAILKGWITRNVISGNASFPLGIKVILKCWDFVKHWKVKNAAFPLGFEAILKGGIFVER